MKLYSRVGETELIDSVVWRHKPNVQKRRAFGVLIPYGKRALLIGVTSDSMICGRVYMRREDAVAAIVKRRAEQEASS